MIDGRESSDNRTWLQRVQEQSWEPEILISGIVLFALFQIPPLIREAAVFLDVHSIMMFSEGNVDDTLSAILLTGTYWLILGFTTHLIGRSIWAAFVGLSYVYNDGIKTEQLKYDYRYKSIISKNGDYINLIIRLEKFCSRIFAVSFLLFMCIVGVFFFLVVVGLFITLMMEIDPDFERFLKYTDPVLQVVGLIYFFDFVSLGLIKRIPIVKKVYYPFYRVMSVLTLAPLYRSIYYGFVTNHKSWKVGLAILVFGTASYFMAAGILQEENFVESIELQIDGGEDYIFPGNYMNLANGEPSKRMLIESDIIERNVARVFIVQSAQYEEYHILKGCNYSEPEDVGNLDLDSLRLECLSQFYILTLNGDTLNPHYLPTKDRELNRRGLVTYIDLSHLPKGVHEFRLLYNYMGEDGIKSPGMVADVEFYKSVPAEPIEIEHGQTSNLENPILEQTN